MNNCTLTTSLAALLLVALAPLGHADAAAPGGPARVVIVPVGTRSAFTPTARVADALVKALRRRKGVRTRLGYFLPRETALPADSDQAAQAYDHAREAFQALEFDAVRQHAATAIRLYKAEIESTGASSGYVKTLHLLAATELFDNREDAAAAAMADALVFDRRPPSSKVFNPAVQQLHAQLRDTTERGEIVLRTKPGALVWFNGRLRGFASRKIRLRLGLYWVRISRPNHAPWLEWVRVHGGQTQELSTTLRPMAGSESRLMIGLRRATRAPSPPDLVRRATRKQKADQIVLVSAETPCRARRCPVAIHWADGRRWLHRSKALYEGDANDTAAQLLGAETSEIPTAALTADDGLSPQRGCRSDSDCIHGHSCEASRCQRPDPISKKWWFWTIVGVVAAGGAAAVALPLTLPKAPVIEVQ